MKYPVLIIRFLLAILFIFAGIQKFKNPLAFADALASFHLLPPPLIRLIALGLPPLEIATGCMLLFACGLRKAALLSLALSACFTAAFAASILRGISVHCGCFGDFVLFGTSAQAGILHAMAIFALSAFLYHYLFTEYRKRISSCPTFAISRP